MLCTTAWRSAACSAAQAFGAHCVGDRQEWHFRPLRPPYGPLPGGRYNPIDLVFHGVLAGDWGSYLVNHTSVPLPPHGYVGGNASQFRLWSDNWHQAGLYEPNIPSEDLDTRGMVQLSHRKQTAFRPFRPVLPGKIPSQWSKYRRVGSWGQIHEIARLSTGYLIGTRVKKYQVDPDHPLANLVDVFPAMSGWAALKGFQSEAVATYTRLKLRSKISTGEMGGSVHYLTKLGKRCARPCGGG